MVERRDPRDDPGAVDREMAWFLSVTNAMKESAPRKTWCRHMRAADPHLNELRTAALISKGVWMCVECIREAGPDALNANPWPDECDLCGATMTAGHFNEMAFNIPGCFVNCTVCDECYGFNKGEDEAEPANLILYDTRRCAKWARTRSGHVWTWEGGSRAIDDAKTPLHVIPKIEHLGRILRTCTTKRHGGWCGCSRWQLLCRG
jgi:hypothetical protein